MIKTEIKTEIMSVCTAVEVHMLPGVNAFLVVHKISCDFKGETHRVEPGHSINHGLFIILTSDRYGEFNA